MSKKFFTNQTDNSLLGKFENVFSKVEQLRYFDVLVGYFRASGYFKVRPFLNKIEKVRILVGINVDKLTKDYHERGLLLLSSPSETRQQFIAEVQKNIQEAHYQKDIEEGILQFIDDLQTGRLEMRAHPTKTIHAKMYIFRSEHFDEDAPCRIISGSSNLTDSGIGSYQTSNYEFNVELRDYEDVKFGLDEFENLWKESVPILEAEAQALKDNTYLRDDFTPYELYLKMLLEYFGKRVEYDPYNIDLLLPDKYYRLKYQSDAANHGYSILMKHNGFILADVVGLGKTIVACMVAKKFVFENGMHTKILVVVPPALQAGWQSTIADFQIENNFRFITIGSLMKVLDEENFDYPNAGEFDMVIVDEAHKFRNDYTTMYVALQDICKRPRIRASENGDVQKKVMLLSATPLNNRPQDIENQLYLFQDKRNSTLDVPNLQEYFKPLNEQYKRLSKEETLDIKALKDLFQQLRNDIIEPLVIRRTRTDIVKNKEYLKDLQDQNIVFPKVEDPIPLYYHLKDNLSALFLDTITLVNNKDKEGLGYYRYRAIEYLVSDEHKRIYGNVGHISERLSAIMRTLLVKRLESSFFAFRKSLVRLQVAIENMLTMFQNDQVFIAPELNVNKLLSEGYTDEQIEAKILAKAGNNKVFSATDFDAQFITHLQHDKVLIDDLVERWNAVKTDPKTVEFSKKLKDVFFDPAINHENKLVIFTEAKETAEELSERIVKSGRRKPLVVSADNRKEVEEAIRTNFDANLAPEKWRNDYNIIITTEVLAEGVNLHRSNIIVNYDVPWNSTRLMQRIGRVNRIGSRAPQVYVYNFYPSAQGDDQIHLVNTALRKLQAFHTAFGEDNKIFSVLEEKGESALFGNKIQEEESEILDYLKELRDFKKQNPKQYANLQKIPNKARCGRKAAGKSLELFDYKQNKTLYPLAKASLAYLKSKNHPGIFCFVTPKGKALTLSFLQAVKIYKAELSEKAIALHDAHYAQTLQAFEFFKQEKNQRNLQQVKAHNLSPAEKTAIVNIRALIKLRPAPQQLELLQHCRQQIKDGVFVAKGLPKSINDFMKREVPTNTDNAVLLEKLFTQVLHTYTFDEVNAEGQTNVNTSQARVIDPQIVITQSFE